MRILIATLVGVVAVVGLVLYFNQPTTDTSSPQNDQDQNADNRNNVSWQSYQSSVNPDIRFSIAHPPQTTVSQIQDTIYEVKYIGPDSEPNTEITDGYYATLMFRETSDLEGYVREQNPHARIQTLQFNGREGMAFTTESELGNQIISHIAYRLFLESDWILDIGYIAHGANAREYRDELLDIFETITVTQTGDVTGEKTVLRIAMLDHDQRGRESNGPTRGCDRVVFVEEVIDATTTPLNASLHTLFAYEDTEVDGWQNFIAKSRDTLFFEEATIENGIASIYLTGELSGLSGVCDNPRASIQIKETALQFDSVDEVVLYLNGEETDLQPSGRGE